MTSISPTSGQSGGGTAITITGSNLTGATAVNFVPQHGMVTGFSDIAVYALKDGETVWAWGYNGNGGLGNGMTTASTMPVQVQDLTGITAIGPGWSAGYAIKSDGTLWDWGKNSYGQLGHGITTNSSLPVQVSGLSGVMALAGTSGSGYALKYDDHMVCRRTI